MTSGQVINDVVDQSERENIETYMFHNLKWHLEPTTDSPATQEEVKDDKRLETTYEQGYLVCDTVQKCKKDVSIFWRHYKQVQPQAVVFMFHGAGSTSEFIAPLANHLREQNLEVFAMDQVAHGNTTYIKKKSNSETTRLQEATEEKIIVPDNLVGNFMHFRDTIWYFIRSKLLEHDSRLRDLPVFIWGESMGGATVLTSLIDYNGYEDERKRIVGAILSAPAITLPQKPNCLATNILVCLSGCLPTLKPIPHDPFSHTRCRRFATYYDEHKQTVAPLPLKLMKEILMMSIYLEDNLNKVNIPMLLVHGEKDVTVSIKGSEMLFATNPTSDKEYLVFEDTPHALITEYSLIEVNHRIAAWIQHRCTTGK